MISRNSSARKKKISCSFNYISFLLKYNLSLFSFKALSILISKLRLIFQLTFTVMHNSFLFARNGFFLLIFL